ncbi:MAG: hypothetical protein GY913_17185 [Proteobacteria bacterium]|nr:hypothetical protein [Pseudomonadota bacterium]MCP4918640.1 hypothetical protein [Pseudomonadota bacterium]
MLFLLTVCPAPELEPVETHVVTVKVRVLPTAGWDPVAMDAEVEWFQDGVLVGTDEQDFAEPTVVDDAGSVIPMRRLAFHDYEHGWAAADGFEPGSYLVTELAGESIDPVGFEVSDIGQVPSTFEVGDSITQTATWRSAIWSRRSALRASRVRTASSSACPWRSARRT